jgi:hypothetical protein
LNGRRRASNSHGVFYVARLIIWPEFHSSYSHINYILWGWSRLRSLSRSIHTHVYLGTHLQVQSPSRKERGVGVFLCLAPVGIQWAVLVLARWSNLCDPLWRLQSQVPGRPRILGALWQPKTARGPEARPLGEAWIGRALDGDHARARDGLGHLRGDIHGQRGLLTTDTLPAVRYEVGSELGASDTQPDAACPTLIRSAVGILEAKNSAVVGYQMPSRLVLVGIASRGHYK